MAERTIGLRLKIDGVEQTITSIKQLESTISTAREKLATVAIGSDEFRRLTGEIQRAETEIGKLRQATEGIGFEKQLEGIGKFTGGITAGFAAATAAVQLFGDDTEEISKAAATAQNLLTVAIGARGVAETIAGAKILATTVATKAQTIANNVANLSFKALYATIAANPLGAILTVIGAVVAALVVFSEETEDTTKAQRELNKVTSDEAIKLQALTAVINSTNSSNEQRLGAINELKKTYPGFNAFITEENKLNEDGIKWVTLKTQALIKQAQINKILEQIAENNNKLLEIQNRSVEESIGFWDKAGGFILRFTSGYGKLGQAVFEGQQALANNTEEADKLNQSNEKLNSSLQTLVGQQQNLNTELTTGNKKLDEQAEKEKKAADAAALRDKALQVQYANQKRRNELISTELAKGLADLKLAYEQEYEAAKKNGENVALVTQVYYKRRNELIKKSQTDLENLTKTVNKELLDIQGRNYKQQIDDVIEVETKKRTEIQKSLDNLKQAGVATQKDIDDANQAIADSLSNQQIKIQQIQTSINTSYLQGQVDLFEKSKQLQTEFFGTEEQLSQDRNQLFVNNFVKYRDTELNKIKLALESAGVEQSTIETTLKTYEDYFQKLGLLQLNSEIIERALTESTKRELDAQLVLNASYYEQLKTIQQQYTIGGKLAQLEDSYEKEKALIIKNGGDLNALTIKYEQDRQKIIKEGEQQTTNEKEIIDNERLQLELEYQAKQLKIQRDALKARLQVLQLDPTINPEKLKEVKAALLKVETEYNDKLSEIQKTQSDKRRESFQESISDLQTYVSEFENLLGSLASVTAQKISYQLQALEVQYERDLAKITENTEEGIKKREEAERIYLANKKQLEKEAQITSLKIQIAQATASAAQSILSVLAAPPPIGGNPILQGILIAANAAIATAQIATISQTIGLVQSMARGGFLRGPSHEQGGIKYQGGGVEVEGNESVINRRSTLAYAPLLSQINMQGGGRPIYVNSVMDSRMAEVLASTKQEPIRAYVLEKDITKSQAVNRRLDQLASY